MIPEMRFASAVPTVKKLVSVFVVTGQQTFSDYVNGKPSIELSGAVTISDTQTFVNETEPVEDG